MVFKRYALKITYTDGKSAFVAFGNAYMTNDPLFYMLYSTLDNAEKAAKKKSKGFDIHKITIVPISCKIKD